MPFYDPVTWFPYLPWAGVAYITWDALPSSLIRGSSTFLSLLAGSLVILLNNWFSQVMQNVPNPYMVRLLCTKLKKQADKT